MNKTLYLAVSTLALTFAMAGTASADAVFDKNCASCHAGGKNIMNPDKTLSMEHLEKNGVNTVDAIKSLVSNGKAPMPGFKGTLDDAQIDAVSKFVLDQAKKGW
ncbi:MAG: c-type cytochrome [Gammaproteobacteria bacterium]